MGLQITETKKGFFAIFTKGNFTRLPHLDEEL